MAERNMNTPQQQEIGIFGEVLFDHFPSGETVLGGAPFNVAWHLQGLGLRPRLLTRVGEDPEGARVLAAMARWGMDSAAVQRDTTRPTGRVTVDIVDGEPHYQIDENCAWDAIEPASGKTFDILYHGSLAARSPRSARTLAELRASRPQLVFVDINLRPPWLEPAALLPLLQGAQWIKLNADELQLLQGGTDTHAARDCLQRLDLRGLVLTRGARGAELLTDGGEVLFANSTADIAVVDTVGAGDAFTAVTLAGLARGWDLAATLQRAQQFAEIIVGTRGATLDDPATYQQLLGEWGEAD